MELEGQTKRFVISTEIQSGDRQMTYCFASLLLLLLLLLLILLLLILLLLLRQLIRLLLLLLLLILVLLLVIERLRLLRLVAPQVLGLNAHVLQFHLLAPVQRGGGGADLLERSQRACRSRSTFETHHVTTGSQLAGLVWLHGKQTLSSWRFWFGSLAAVATLSVLLATQFYVIDKGEIKVVKNDSSPLPRYELHLRNNFTVQKSFHFCLAFSAVTNTVD